MTPKDIPVVIAFLAGILTFFSPCLLPLIPFYLSYITGYSIDDLAKRNDRKVIMDSLVNSIFFVIGFSVIFIGFGVGISFLGEFLLQVEDLIRVVGGALIVFFGLVVSGVFRLRFLQTERRLNIQNKPFGYFGAFIVGMAFSSGWVPCVGPVLSSILIIAGTKHSVWEGFLLLIFYSLGLGLPIVLSAVMFNYAFVFFKKMMKYVRAISVVSGIILIILGLLVMTDYLSELAGMLAWIFKFKGI